MDTLPLSAPRVSPQIKALLRKLQRRRRTTHCGLLERLADLAVCGPDEADVQVVNSLLRRFRELRSDGLLEGDEALLLREWVAARQRVADTFARFLIRADLLGSSLLAQPELMAFKRSLKALGHVTHSTTASTRRLGRPSL